MELVLLFDISNGLLIGFFYALMALGLALILGLNGVINFAHGGFMALGGYVAFSLAPLIGFWGALVLAPFFIGALGIAVERGLIRPLYGRDPLFSLLLTFGLAMIMEDLIRTGWGAQGLPFAIPKMLGSPVSSTYFFITGYRLLVVAVTAAATAALFCLLAYTRMGVRIRAGTLDLDTVSVLGVNVRGLRAFNFALGIFLAGLSGVLAGGQLSLQPNMGDGLMMPSFVAIIVGGVGSLPGTLLGGLLIGLATGVVTMFWPAASEAVIYVIMAIVLLMRPRGLMGEEGMMT